MKLPYFLIVSEKYTWFHLFEKAKNKTQKWSWVNDLCPPSHLQRFLHLIPMYPLPSLYSVCVSVFYFFPFYSGSFFLCMLCSGSFLCLPSYILFSCVALIPCVIFVASSAHALCSVFLSAKTRSMDPNADTMEARGSNLNTRLLFTNHSDSRAMAVN